MRAHFHVLCHQIYFNYPYATNDKSCSVTFQFACLDLGVIIKYIPMCFILPKYHVSKIPISIANPQIGYKNCDCHSFNTSLII